MGVAGDHGQERGVGEPVVPSLARCLRDATYTTFVLPWNVLE